MSCLVAIGCQVPHAARIDSVCRAQRFIRVDEVNDDYVRELANAAHDFSPNSKWFVAMDFGGIPDLDLAYDIPTALKGRWGLVIEPFQCNDDIQAIELLICDLGTNQERTYDNLSMRDMKQTLQKWYELGASNCTVYHKFIRD